MVHDEIVIESLFADLFVLMSHSGQDVVEFRGNSEVENAYIYLGDGNDVVDAEKGASWVSIPGSLAMICGDDGRDTLVNPDYFQNAGPYIDGFEVIED